MKFRKSANVLKARFKKIKYSEELMKFKKIFFSFVLIKMSFIFSKRAKEISEAKKSNLQVRLEKIYCLEGEGRESGGLRKMKDAGKLLSIKLKGGNPMRKRNIWKKYPGLQLWE